MSGFDPFAHQEDEYCGYDDDDMPEAGAKETTGRWTREEHHIFIKGLELYGKAWKKIALAIKTRTVVQIRTHAQKYFLKLSKARQNGDNSLSKGLGSGGKRRKSDRQVAISVPLRPFIVKPMNGSATSGSVATGAIAAVANGADPTSFSSAEAGADAASANEYKSSDSCLQDPNGDVYFMRDVKSGEAVGVHASMLDESGGGGGEDGAANMQGDSECMLPANANSIKTAAPKPHHNTHVEAEKCLYNFLSAELHRNARHPPEWYQRGGSVSALLADAEKLDWSVDSGVPIPLTQITNTNAAYKPPSEEIARQMLVHASSTYDSLSALRGAYGHGHGHSSKLQPSRTLRGVSGSVGVGAGVMDVSHYGVPMPMPQGQEWGVEVGGGLTCHDGGGSIGVGSEPGGLGLGNHDVSVHAGIGDTDLGMDYEDYAMADWGSGI